MKEPKVFKNSSNKISEINELKERIIKETSKLEKINFFDDLYFKLRYEGTGQDRAKSRFLNQEISEKHKAFLKKIDVLAEKLGFSSNSRIILHNMVMSNDYDYLSNIKPEWKKEYESDLIQGKKKYQNSTEIISKEDDLNINMILDNNMKEFNMITSINKIGYTKNILNLNDLPKKIKSDIFGNNKLTELKSYPKSKEQNQEELNKIEIKKEFKTYLQNKNKKPEQNQEVLKTLNFN